jgi:sugar lactone lactonase YvrE
VIAGCAGNAPVRRPAFDTATGLRLVRIIDAQTLRDRFGGATARSEILRITEPSAIAVLSDGTLVLADRGREQLLRFALRGAEWSRFPTDDFHSAVLARPRAVRLDAVGNVYACDEIEGRVAIFDARMRLADWLTDPPYDALGLVPGRIVGIAFGPLGEIYLSDEVNGRVYRLDASGQFLSALGTEEDLWARLVSPAGLACAPHDGAVYVCDPGLGRIVVYDIDGTPRNAFGEGILTEPVAVVVDGHGGCLVADRKEQALVQFSPRGHLVARFSGEEIISGGLGGPTDIFMVDSTIWVADPPTGRILALRLRR